jgi:hypothetical protein
VVVYKNQPHEGEAPSSYRDHNHVVSPDIRAGVSMVTSEDRLLRAWLKWVVSTHALQL